MLRILFNKKWRFPTFIKYFCSYLFVFTALILGFYLILKNQILNKYTEQALSTTLSQLDIISSQLEDDLLYLTKLDSSITKNTDLISQRYDLNTASRFQTLQEIKKHISSTPMVQSVVYLPLISGIPFSTMLNVSWQDNLFHIKNVVNGQTEIFTFDPLPYLDATHPQLILLSENNQTYLIYFPVISSNSNYIFFYTLDPTTISQKFNGILSDSVVSVALIDHNMNIATGTNTSLLLPYLTSDHLKDQISSDPINKKSILELDSTVSLCYYTGINNNFTIVCMLSNDFLAEQIASSFADTYLALLLLGFLGFLLIMLAMNFTYVPLHRLTNKLIPDFDSKQPHLHQLEEAFSESNTRNQILSNKLNNYRISIQKSLIDSILPTQTTDFSNLDQFFDQDTQKKLHIIHMSSTQGQLDHAALQKYLTNYLTNQDCLLLLKQEKNSAVFLINDTKDSFIDETLSTLLHKLYKEMSVMSAISQSSSSPLDIPSLYENAKNASKEWPSQPVVYYETLPHMNTSHNYPHDLLQQLNEALTKYDFLEAKYSVDNLFRIINNQIQTKTDLTEFYIQCIWIDVLTNLINCMNQNYIPFNTYNELYYSTLYLCRSCDYQKNLQEILSNIHKLLDICEQKIIEKHMTAPFKQIIEECCLDPDFSLSMLADRFHVSTAYMSQWFKLELNSSFSDYLWSLRLTKAQELLLSTNMSIDEISVAVGYLNTSSFRRKYKQETGITPSQYRSIHSQNL